LTASKPIKVFIVEDQDTIREMMMESLSILEYDAIPARDYQSALEIVQKNKDEIGVLMCDMVLGRHRGPDLVKELRQWVPHCPVIYTSGYSPEEIFPENSSGNVELFLPKPFTIDSLREVLQKALGEDASDAGS